jgi:L-lactate dehydrogenase complex protein LldG
MIEQSREVVMARVRTALDRDAPRSAEARQRVEHRLAHPEPALVPARGQLDMEGRIALFTAQAEAVQTDVARIAGWAALPALVADYLRGRNLPPRAVMAEDSRLLTADWAAAMVDFRIGRAEDADQVGITTAFAGIAETGTSMLLSDGRHPTTLAFLPETSVIALPSARVLPAYEDGLRLLREEHDGLPRSVNLVTGPSRSGDIEQKLLLGAHGPRRLLTVLVDEDRGSSAGA